MEMTDKHLLEADVDHRMVGECRMVQAVIKIADEITMGNENQDQRIPN